jgi:hypothetical protein
MDHRQHSRKTFIFLHYSSVILVGLLMMNMDVGSRLAMKLYVAMALLPVLCAVGTAKHFPRLAVTCLISAAVTAALTPITLYVVLIMSLFSSGLHM